MKIGELSKRSGCSVQTIRYYEKEGLLASKSRSEGNFRLYDQVAESQLMFVKRCRNFGLSLKEIKELLMLSQQPKSRCDQVNEMIDAHIKQVDERIEELTSLAEHLGQLRENCSEERTVEKCGIIKNLSYDGIPN